jgi:RHS repeat-associated protein
MIEKSKGTGLQTWYYTYDNKNNLLTVNETSNGSTSIMTATYSYDVFGNMVAEAEWQTGGSAVTTEHVYDPQTGNLLLDLNSSNAVQIRYLSGTSQNEYLGRQDGSGNTSWYLTDRLGSVIGLTNGSGTATDTIVYDGFGNMTLNSAPTVTGNIGFQGMFTDPATGQSGSGARQEEYNPTTGSWTNPDPSGLTSGSNLYEAMGNEPTNGTDPSGLDVIYLLDRRGTAGSSHAGLLIGPVTVNFLVPRASNTIYPDMKGVVFDGTGQRGVWLYFSFSGGNTLIGNAKNLKVAYFKNLPQAATSKNLLQYDSYLYFNSSRAQSTKAAKAIINAFYNHGYNLFTNNCNDACELAIASIGVIGWKHNIKPTNAYELNQNLTEIKGRWPLFTKVGFIPGPFGNVLGIIPILSLDQGKIDRKVMLDKAIEAMDLPELKSK